MGSGTVQFKNVRKDLQDLGLFYEMFEEVSRRLALHGCCQEAEGMRVIL